MAQILAGRLYGWPEFSDDGQDIWLIHLEEPGFFMRVVEPPAEDPDADGDGEEDGDAAADGLVRLPEARIAFANRSGLALGNLVFFEPRPADMAVVAQAIAGMVAAIEDDMVLDLIGITTRGYAPAQTRVELEDMPTGYLIGSLYDSDEGLVGDDAWVAHLGPPPFALMASDITQEDVADEAIWATVDGDRVLTGLIWLSSLACAPEELRRIAGEAAALLRDSEDPTAD
ncbi:MAG: hypothetical protein RIE31_06230 [Alphaproteobacteria bacterium]